MYPRQVYSDGVAVDVRPGSVLVIGDGANREIVTVGTSIIYNFPTIVAPIVPGYAMVSLAAPLQKNHYPGESVSNIIPGNPGPRGVGVEPPAFDVNAPMYQPVVPLWSRVP